MSNGIEIWGERMVLQRNIIPIGESLHDFGKVNPGVGFMVMVTVTAMTMVWVLTAGAQRVPSERRLRRSTAVPAPAETCMTAII